MDSLDHDLILRAYENAEARYRSFGIDTNAVLEEFYAVPISLHCWQGDDVKGFEEQLSAVSQNLVTGNYPGAARSGDELRQDIDEAFSMSPCRHRVNLHSIYAEPAAKKERSEYCFEDFEKWARWAKKNGYGVDFNASFFTHEMVKNGFTRVLLSLFILPLVL